MVLQIGPHVELAPNMEFSGYRLVRFRGIGGQGEVWEALQVLTGRAYALKISLIGVDDKTRWTNRNMLKREAELSLSMAQATPLKCFVKLHAHLYQASLRRYVLVYELLQQDLHNWLYRRPRLQRRRLELTRLKGITIQLLHGLEALEQQGIVHCDIRIENIMFWKDGRDLIKIIDFGMAKQQSAIQTQAKSRDHYPLAGILENRAPEVVLRLPYTCRVDTWSLGVVLLRLATGSVLFHALLAGEEGLDETNYNETCLMHEMVRVFGYPPAALLDKSGVDLHRFSFVKRPDGSYSIPKDILGAECGASSRPLSSYDSELCGSEEQKRQFFDLVQQLMHYEPELRLSAAQALKHVFLAEARGFAKASSERPSRQTSYFGYQPVLRSTKGESTSKNKQQRVK